MKFFEIFQIERKNGNAGVAARVSTSIAEA